MRVLAFVFALAAIAPISATAAELVAVARLPSDARDSRNETLGGIGSGMALVPDSWAKSGSGYRARLAMLPDRGWNTEGTSDYQARLQMFDVVLTPKAGDGHEDGLTLTYRKTLLLWDAEGRPTTGLDPTAIRTAKDAMPALPVAANGHVSLDSEAVVLLPGGGAWVGDEYGPIIYRFDKKGRMSGAVRPPDAFIPIRQGRESFSANNPPHGEHYDRGNPENGRQDNQGLEGVGLSPDRKYLFAVNQSALVQDLDPAAVKTSRRHVRLLQYDISGRTPRLVHEYAIVLPLYDGNLVAAQSELLVLDDHRMLLLCRDSGGGFTGKRDASHFRSIMMVDLDGATDIAGRFDGRGESIAPKGVLRPGIVPAALTPVLDMNDNVQLDRFGLHNGAPNDSHDLYEKWESMALAPTLDPKAPDDFFLFVGSDNDFITQHGMMAGKPYADGSGADVDSLVLVYRVSLGH